MPFEFATPDLRSLDTLVAEVIACSVWADERPLHGLAGLVDWRLAGTLSELARSGYLSGQLDEVLLVPGRPRLPFDKVLVFGAGSRGAFAEDVFRRVVAHMLQTMDGLHVHRAIVELPGRADDIVTAERAVQMMLECAGHSHVEEMIRLVERPEQQKRLELGAKDEQRRRRRV